jgi:WD40 repeat protein
MQSEISLWNPITGQRLGQPISDDTPGAYNVSFSPDGKTLAAATGYGIVTLWDVATKQPVARLLTGESERSSVAFSRDGKTLAGSGYDMIVFWDVATRQYLGHLHTSELSSIVFSSDGKTLAFGSRDGSITLWDLEPQTWLEKTCQRVGRNFTQTEWKQYFSDEPYHITCPQWPAEE